jgi:lysophospholipase L1-like esterase
MLKSTAAKPAAGFLNLVHAACCLSVVLLSASASRAAPGIILGDSLGVGVSMAAGVPRLAHNSVAIRSADALEQIKRTPRGTVAFISLGTNDAVGSIHDVEPGIDRIIDTAKTHGVKLVWIGPPCVLKSWNTNVEKLDSILKRKLSAGPVAYVSVADAAVCDRSIRAGDGVHFNMRGYAMLWGRAREAAGVTIDANPAQLGSRKIRRVKHRRKAPRRWPGHPHVQLSASAAQAPAGTHAR